MKYFCAVIFLLNLSFNVSYAQSTQTLISYADSLYAKLDWSAAATAYENAFAKGATQNALSFNRLGFSYLNIGKNDLSIKNFQLSLTKNPPPAGSPIIRSR